MLTWPGAGLLLALFSARLPRWGWFCSAFLPMPSCHPAWLWVPFPSSRLVTLPPVRCGLPGLVRYGIVVLPRCLVLCCVGLVRHLLYNMLLVL